MWFLFWIWGNFDCQWSCVMRFTHSPYVGLCHSLYFKSFHWFDFYPHHSIHSHYWIPLLLQKGYGYRHLENSFTWRKLDFTRQKHGTLHIPYDIYCNWHMEFLPYMGVYHPLYFKSFHWFDFYPQHLTCVIEFHWFGLYRNIWLVRVIGFSCFCLKDTATGI